jgi:hypothetical protein
VDWITSLAEAGRCLDAHGQLRVFNDGVVVPSAPVVTTSNSGVEKCDVRSESARRSETGPRSRSPRWEGAPVGSRTASTPPPIISGSLKKQYEVELNGLGEFYPGTQLWYRPDGVWLLWKSRVLDGLPQHALFLTGICYTSLTVRSWGFWAHELAKPRWIGPRHTNFVDGSVCAFEPKDETWVFGASIVSLLDICSVWALRQLHLDVFGKWPGMQVAHYRIERVLEQRDNEYCGCGSDEKLYTECCKSRDIARANVADAVQFLFIPRSPPSKILAVISGQEIPPTIADILR